MTTLEKKLKIVKTAISKSHENMFKIRDMYKDGTIKFVSGDVNEYIGTEMQAWLLKDRHSPWSTYDGCRLMDIREDGTVEVVVYNGSLYDGTQISLRWKAVFSGFPMSELKMFKDCIEHMFEYKLDDLYEKEQEDAKNKRLKEIADSLLK